MHWHKPAQDMAAIASVLRMLQLILALVAVLRGSISVTVPT
jgi:hypothetical protein